MSKTFRLEKHFQSTHLAGFFSRSRVFNVFFVLHICIFIQPIATKKWDDLIQSVSKGNLSNQLLSPDWIVVSQGDADFFDYEVKQSDASCFLQYFVLQSEAMYLNFKRCIHHTKTLYHKRWINCSIWCIHRSLQCIHRSLRSTMYPWRSLRSTIYPSWFTMHPSYQNMVENTCIAYKTNRCEKKL